MGAARDDGCRLRCDVTFSKRPAYGYAIRSSQAFGALLLCLFVAATEFFAATVDIIAADSMQSPITRKLQAACLRLLSPLVPAYSRFLKAL